MNNNYRKSSPGFIAALDQSGGSTPGALHAYGINDDAWSSDDEMFAIVHQMRTRIITSPSFTGERILGAILFENTMDRDIEGQPSADYLWNVKQVVPFLKVDKGLAAEENGVHLMKPMSDLTQPDKWWYLSELAEFVAQSTPCRTCGNRELSSSDLRILR